ncbi:MAG: hypothetical protein IFK94_13670 [Acidobacteria bacterium]|uniref:Adhesin domain-containing protein n=1 Tax=Candidatus Polarisedimenticola svalbardensis TaxID=2886004 RepID=A0A8J7C3I8_9BACT|nr:hypothetical protein [Candidatus Polarisedimenticola svalbardensis]
MMTDLYRPCSKLCRAALLAAVLVSFTGIAAGEPEYLASSAAGLYEIDNESILRVEGFEGRITIRAGGEGQIRFLSSDLEDRNKEIPAEIWKDGRTLILRPEQDGSTVPVRLEAAVPPGISLDLLLFDSELTLANIYGDVALKGEDLDAKGFGIEGDVTLDVRGGTIRFQTVNGEFDLESRAANVTIDGVTGGFRAELQGGRLEAGKLGGPVEVDGEDAEVILNGNEDSLRVSLSGGFVKTTGVGNGGQFRLNGTTLDLKECRGDIHVETDAAIGFSECTADLHFDAYGSSVTGTGNQGILEIKTDDARIELRRIIGPSRIQGDRLQVDIQEAGGELWVLGTSSNIKIDKATDRITATNEFGDIHILNATNMVSVESRDGNVTIERQAGPVEISAEGENVSVTWTSVNWTENSVVENAGGDVSLYLPTQGGCTVDARTNYGRIDTDIEELIVEDDGKSAAGSFNRARKPFLRVRAKGDLKIMKAPVLE